MNIMFIIFTLMTFSMFKILYTEFDQDQPSIDFPTLSVTTFDFIDLSGGCSGFTDCIEYVGAVIYNFTVGLIFLILFVVNLLIYLFELFLVIVNVSFTGIEGAPFWFNGIVSLVYGGSIAFIIYKLIRRGSADSET